jgi:hypothetical protein
MEASAVRVTGVRSKEFKPQDMYPGSLLRHLNICPDCGYRLHERLPFCYPCELEARVVAMTARARVASRGYYFTAVEDRLEFSPLAQDILRQEAGGNLALLRRPPIYPRLGDLLAFTRGPRASG